MPLHKNLRAVLLAGAASLIFSPAALATDTIIASGNTGGATTLGGTDTLTIQGNGLLTTTSNPAVTVGTGTGMVITNAGTIQSTGGNASRAIRLTGSAGSQHAITINNLATGIIQTDGDVIQGNNSYPTGPIVLNNYGLIQSTGSDPNNGQAIDFNNNTSPSAITINNYAGGVIKAADSDAIRPGPGATINNYGQIISNFVTGANGADSSNDGIDYQNPGNTGTVNNFAGGSITGSRDGITAKEGLTVNNSGTITGLDGSGMNIDSTTNASVMTVVNNATGVITGTALNGDGDGIDVDHLLNLTNSGKIQAVGIFAGDLNEALAIGGGTVVNNAGGIITSVQRAITVDDSNLGNAFGAIAIDNAGTITGQDGEAIKVTSILANTLTNRATGVINGSVVMGAGADTVNLYAGQVLNGTLDGGAGADILNLLGSGNATLTGVSNIETLNVGGGVWSLGGTQSYAIAVNVTGGTLRATGTLTSATLSVANGGTLALGNAAPATVALQGNLSLAHGATLSAYVTPSAASRINVTGTAALDGVFLVNPAAGNYAVGTHYTVLNATGGISGQFASTTTAVPSYFKPRLSYDTNNVYLNLDQVSLAGLTSGTTGNQKSVSGGIDAAVAAGAVPGSAFQGLFGLSGAALNAALDQISGAMNANIGQSVSYGAFMPFMNLMLSGGDSADAVTMAQIAPGTLYGSTDAPLPAQLVPQRLRVWGSVYGSHAGLSADTVSGAASLSATSVGGAGGVESQFDDGTRLGVSLGGGHQDFTSGNGVGDSSDVMLGIYGRTNILDRGYVAAAMGYGWHDITTTRTVTVSGTDVLAAKFDAHEIGGRIEAGYRLDGVTPFVALAGDAFAAPGYGESAASGSAAFALNYAAHVTDTAHTELGARLARDIAMDDGTLSLGAMAAWAHSLDGSPTSVAAFQGLAGPAFQVTGTRAAADTAILGLDLGMQTGSGLSYGVAVNGQVGHGTTILSGSGTLAWRW